MKNLQWGRSSSVVEMYVMVYIIVFAILNLRTDLSGIAPLRQTQENSHDSDAPFRALVTRMIKVAALM